jgi:hypothetical protein
MPIRTYVEDHSAFSPEEIKVIFVSRGHALRDRAEKAGTPQRATG